mmetsp:Transcript_7824/g.13683  ORF Transcript_7824/g.13683 Transcript_7824/m.13683 type:complete len:216 (-) Transcript_7824:248-895(-)
MRSRSLASCKVRKVFRRSSWAPSWAWSSWAVRSKVSVTLCISRWSESKRGCPSNFRGSGSSAFVGVVGVDCTEAWLSSRAAMRVLKSPKVSEASNSCFILSSRKASTTCKRWLCLFTCSSTLVFPRRLAEVAFCSFCSKSMFLCRSSSVTWRRTSPSRVSNCSLRRICDCISSERPFQFPATSANLRSSFFCTVSVPETRFSMPARVASTVLLIS